ncbi:MAG: L-histidine N(alpha)-methyltransferase [Anaerolineae bacterium]
MLKTLSLTDYHPTSNGLYSEVLAGLKKGQKELPCKLFYDARGSQLFEQICDLPEYYQTRTEQSIMDRYIEEIAALLGPGCLLIEYGSGSSRKTRTLLDHLPDLAGYVPIDISREHLMRSAVGIAISYPDLEVLPVCADYEAEFQIPTPSRPVSRQVIYYPGSTIGNFHPPDAAAFLRRMRAICGRRCELLIGVDLKKERSILHNAYNDSAGITAAFNLNVLARLNHELGTDFDLDGFRHQAIYNEQAGRIEMHLISLREQRVLLNGSVISFAAGETIWTESSYKYALKEFAALASQAGFTVAKVWTDPQQLFSVQYLV